MTSEEDRLRGARWEALQSKPYPRMMSDREPKEHSSRIRQTLSNNKGDGRGVRQVKIRENRTFRLSHSHNAGSKAA